jgi:hypothetical protein
MEPKKEISDFDLDSLDLEVFSTTAPRKIAKKQSRLVDLLGKTYTKTALTLFLLLFLFGSTFFIASRVNQPSFTTSSADVGYIPMAQIDIPQPVGVRSCSEVNYESGEITFLQSYCRGDICINQVTEQTCEELDAVVLENGTLSEENGQDGVPDCVWVEEESSCKPKY